MWVGVVLLFIKPTLPGSWWMEAAGKFWSSIETKGKGTRLCKWLTV